MPARSNDENHSTHLAGIAVTVANIATGEIAETPIGRSGQIRSGLAGGDVRVDSLTKEERGGIARMTAATRCA